MAGLTSVPPYYISATIVAGFCSGNQEQILEKGGRTARRTFSRYGPKSTREPEQPACGNHKKRLTPNPARQASNLVSDYGPDGAAFRRRDAPGYWLDRPRARANKPSGGLRSPGTSARPHPLR